MELSSGFRPSDELAVTVACLLRRPAVWLPVHSLTPQWLAAKSAAPSLPSLRRVRAVCFGPGAVRLDLVSSSPRLALLPSQAAMMKAALRGLYLAWPNQSRFPLQCPGISRISKNGCCASLGR